MEIWLKLCGGVLLLVVAIVLTRGVRGEAVPLQWLAILSVAAGCLAMLSPVLEWMQALADASGMSDRMSLLLRGLGVAFLTQICTDVCKQSGETTLAGGVEMAGKAEILLLCLPLFRELIDAAQGLLDGI